jgi:tRNA 2-thiouridine synthesizing protein E
MAWIESAGKTIKIDDDGFLIEFSDWSEDVAKKLAAREGIATLTDEQIETIKFLRKYFEKFKSFPILNYVCKNIHQPRECINEQFINPELAWKIAGLPKLAGIHFVAVDGKHYLMEECC